jgi:hypothetical protein
MTMAITFWHRVECDTVFDDPARGIESGLGAAIYDPLWMLGRQLQLGELHADDGGSVVGAAVTPAISRIREPGPLEAHVESCAQPADLRLRARGGLLFVDLLAESHLDAAISRVSTQYGFLAAEDDLVTGAPDGDRILAAIDAGTIAGTLGSAASSLQPAWYGERIGRGATDRWVGELLEHSFSLTGDGGLALSAPAYRGPDLDWDAFDLHAAATGGTAPTPVSLLPLAIDIPGLPSSRFWEVEDPRFDAGQLTAGPGEVARVLLAEVAMCYAGDWSVVPCKFPVASVARIDHVDVTDTFGVRATIVPATTVRPDPQWNLWGLAGGAPDLRFVPDRVDTLDSEPIEELTFVRDELANVVWAHERVVPSPLGTGEPIESADDTSPVPPASRADLVYLPLPRLPTGRIPLGVVDSVDPARLLAIAKTVAATSPPPIRGTILGSAFRMRDGELGDDGIVLTRRARVQRRGDGTLIVWTARRRRPGASQPAISLDFDALVLPPPP